ncbi:MAG: hypothetical protein AAF431_03630 [Pseudomonadota bacterium]
MSLFEYVSVAIALIYALAVGRLLAGLAPSLDKNKRYPIHFAWVLALLLVCALQWWQLWRTREVDWNSIRFFWVLVLPSLIYLRATILLGAEPNEVKSYREHYFAHRVPFFVLGVLSALVIFLTPWLLGIIPWLQFDLLHIAASVLLLISLLGLIFKKPAVHALLVLFNFGLALGSILHIQPV